MNNLPLKFFLLLCGFFLSACSNNNVINADAVDNGDVFVPATAETDNAMIYIYRSDQMANSLYSPGLLINGEFKLYLKKGVNSRLSLAPGEYQFEIQNEKKYSELTPLSLILKAGSTYFIRVDTTLKIQDKTSYEPYLRSFTFSLQDKQQAVKEIAECCADNGKKSSNDKNAAAEKQDEPEGFSVDKTQNPFSH